MRNSLRTTTTILSVLFFAFVLCSCTTTVVQQCECPHVEEPICGAFEETDESLGEANAAIAPEVDVTTETGSPMEAEAVLSEGVASEEAFVGVPWTIGETGPNGGLVFCCDDIWLEMFEPVYEVESYQAALDWCESLSGELDTAVRMPSVSELLAIYAQLVETELCEADWTYYWSCESIDENSARIVNFDTGFEGSFYKNLGFISLIPVAEI